MVSSNDSSICSFFDVSENECLLDRQNSDIEDVNMTHIPDENVRHLEYNNENLSSTNSISKLSQTSLIILDQNLSDDDRSTKATESDISHNQSSPKLNTFYPSEFYAPSSPMISYSNSMPIKVYGIRLLISIAIFLLSIIIQAYFVVLSDQFYRTGEPSLRDRVHDAFGGKMVHWMTANVVNTFCFLLYFLTLVRFVIFAPWQISFAIWTRFCYCISFLYIVRGIAVVVTTLPSPLESCVPVTALGFSDILKSIMLIVFGEVYECTDMIISGHTLFITSLFMLWIFYSNDSPFIFFFVFFYWIWCLIVLNLSFFHYTVDIFIAVILSISVWSLYHMVLDASAAFCLSKMLQIENASKSTLSSVICSKKANSRTLCTDTVNDKTNKAHMPILFPHLVSNLSTMSSKVNILQGGFFSSTFLSKHLMKFVIFVEALDFRIKKYLEDRRLKECLNSFEVDFTTPDMQSNYYEKRNYNLFTVDDASNEMNISNYPFLFCNKNLQSFTYDYMNQKGENTQNAGKVMKNYNSSFLNKKLNSFCESYCGNSSIYWGNIRFFVRKCFKKFKNSKRHNISANVRY